MPLSEQETTAIVQQLKKALLKCTPPMVIAKESDAGMELIGNKEVPYGSKKQLVPGMYFSSYVVRKDMVSFYLFPMYMHMPEFEPLMPTLKKSLKGKSCFNFKKSAQIEPKELAAILKQGVAAFKKFGYMK